MTVHHKDNLNCATQILLMRLLRSKTVKKHLMKENISIGLEEEAVSSSSRLLVVTLKKKYAEDNMFQPDSYLLFLPIEGAAMPCTHPVC